jgi:hypothetical protein
MPSIAASARAHHAAFYWHLGDLRAIYDFDEDFRVLHPNATIAEYLSTAWPDFERNQIEPFADLPFFVGIGNHETIPPKTRDEFIVTFADWLNAPAIREQRLKDDPHDHKVRTYYSLEARGRGFHQPRWILSPTRGETRLAVRRPRESPPTTQANGHPVSSAMGFASTARR